MNGQDILLISFSICIVIFTINYVLCNCIIPCIKDYINFKNTINKYENYSMVVEDLTKEIKLFNYFIQNLTNKYHDNENLKKCARELSDSIANYIVAPTLKERKEWGYHG